MRTNFRNCPYGFYRTGNSIVYFDRRYRPIVRVSDSATVCDPLEWIEHTGQEWFYNDGSAPRYDSQTRDKLKRLMDSIPAMAEEVRRRDVAERKAGALAPRNWSGENSFVH